MEQCCFAGFVGLDADSDEVVSESFGGEVLAGVAAGEEPSGVAGDVEALAASGEVVDDQGVEQWWHLDRGAAEGDVDRGVGGGDLVGAHGGDAVQGLGEEQGEQSAEAGVAAQAGVVEEAVDVFPALFVTDGDLGLGRGCCGDAEAGVDPGVA